MRAVPDASAAARSRHATPLLTVCLLALATATQAQPPAPAAFCDVYPQAPACAAGAVQCTMCHTVAPSLNPYGANVSANLAPGEPRPLSTLAFTNALPAALAAAEDLDSDGDGFVNLAEIEAGSAPSSALSIPVSECVDDDDDGWELCGYDVNYTYKKVMLDFCGRSPTLAEREAFASEPDPTQLLHATLDACLDSEHWRGIGGRVWNLANRKIKPIEAIKSGKNAGPIPLADFDDDYAYFVWTQTDGHDVRDVLVGQYFVSARYVDGVTEYEKWNLSPNEDLLQRGYDRYQAVVEERRAGLLTHRWFLMSNTMFTAIPRTSAAQAYRAFLGLDLSKLEGLFPVDGEPVDYDAKDVTTAECATCHSTLDPLAYPFTRYEGIGGGSPFAEPYSYNPNRLDWFMETDGALVAETPESGVLFGQPVADLVEWANVGANSPQFRDAAVLDYWEMLLGEPPRGTEQAEFVALSEGLAVDYSVENMLHALIDTEAYGAP